MRGLPPACRGCNKIVSATQAQRRHEERLAALERRLDAIADRWGHQLTDQEAAATLEAAKQQQQRSNSFYGMFSLSRS